MPIHFDQLEIILDKWLSFLMMQKPTNDAASWYTYKIMQKSTKIQFMKDMSDLFNKVTQEDVEIIEKNNKKYYVINRSKL